MTDLLIDSLIRWLINKPTNWLIDELDELVKYFVDKSVTDWQTKWKMEGLNGCSINCCCWVDYLTPINLSNWLGKNELLKRSEGPAVISIFINKMFYGLLFCHWSIDLVFLWTQRKIARQTDGQTNKQMKRQTYWLTDQLPINWPKNRLTNQLIKCVIKLRLTD